jgi:hypothetical protein
MYETNLEKIKLVLQNLEKAIDHLKAFIETAEMPEAIITLLNEQGSQKQDFLASVLGVSIRELNDAIQYLKKNDRVTTKGRIGTSNCVIESKEVTKEAPKKGAKKAPAGMDEFQDDLKKLEEILSMSEEQF